MASAVGDTRVKYGAAVTAGQTKVAFGDLAVTERPQKGTKFDV